MIHIIHSRATMQRLEEMLQGLGTYIKLAVDIWRSILAGGGVLRADCETALLDDGSSKRISGVQTGIPLPNRSPSSRSSIFARARTTLRWKFLTQPFDSGWPTLRGSYWGGI